MAFVGLLPKRFSWSSQHSDTSMASNLSPSSAAARFDLDPHDNSPIVVFDHRGIGTHMSSQAKLCAYIDSHPGFRVTKKAIPTGVRDVDIYLQDFYIGAEHEEFRKSPGNTLCFASSHLPLSVFLGRNMFNWYDQLYIICLDRNPPGEPQVWRMLPS